MRSISGVDRLSNETMNLVEISLLFTTKGTLVKKNAEKRMNSWPETFFLAGKALSM